MLFLFPLFPVVFLLDGMQDKKKKLLSNRLCVRGKSVSFSSLVLDSFLPACRKKENAFEFEAWVFLDVPATFFPIGLVFFFLACR